MINVTLLFKEEVALIKGAYQGHIESARLRKHGGRVGEELKVNSKPILHISGMVLSHV